MFGAWGDGRGDLVFARGNRVGRLGGDRGLGNIVDWTPLDRAGAWGWVFPVALLSGG